MPQGRGGCYAKVNTSCARRLAGTAEGIIPSRVTLCSSEGPVPLLKGEGHVGDNIREFRTGKTFAHTEEKFGKKRAEKQAVAVALHEQDQSSEREYMKPAGRK